jgi:hypothetical protein
MKLQQIAIPRPDSAVRAPSPQVRAAGRSSPRAARAASLPAPMQLHGRDSRDLSAVARSLQSRPSASSLQFKLYVGSVSDPLEREADQVADRVMRMPDPAAPSALPIEAVGSPRLQRACAECEKEEGKGKKQAKRPDEEDDRLKAKAAKRPDEEDDRLKAKAAKRPDEEDDRLKAKAAKRTDDELIKGKSAKHLQRDELVQGERTGEPGPIGPELEHRLRSLGGGESLPAAERSFFEPRFGNDFGGVRVHTGTEAGGLARDLGARAFTLGRDIVFAPGNYAPGTGFGRHLLAHELTHVVQQGAGEPGAVQRELEMPLPAKTPAAQADLTPAQIKTALDFNKMRYNAVSTKLIQDIVGTTPTGTWVEADIKAIAATQGEYGLKKDGMVGPNMFRFLDKEVSLEKLDKKDEHCLVSLTVLGKPVNVSPVVGGSRSITATFNMYAQFPKHCKCADYEYRQFIKGHWKRIRGGVTTDLGHTFTTLPGGAGLTPGFQEDGNTTTAALNYGHRTQPAEGSNHYLDDKNAVDQAGGCRYEGEDTPGGPDAVLPGDVFDVEVAFRGEVQRKGAVVATQHWTPIKGKFPVL